MKKVLVTGSSGLTGSAVAEHFHNKGWEVTGLDNNMRAHFFGTERREDPNTLNIDIRNMVDVEDLFHEKQFDAIVHTAAQPSHDYATDHVIEDFSVNVLGTLNLLECTRQYSPEAVFVHISTDKVYGENMSCGLQETETRFMPDDYIFNDGFDESLGLDFAGDRSFFGCSKAAADIYAQQYAARGMKVGIFRPGCITGKNHAGAEQHGFLAYLAKCIKDEKVYKIFGHKGKQVRDQIHADDLASAISYFVEAPTKDSVFNMGGGPDRSVSVIEAIALLEHETGKKAQIEFHEPRKGDRIWDVHDVSKFRKAYPEWDYDYSLLDIIRDLV